MKYVEHTELLFFLFTSTQSIARTIELRTFYEKFDTTNSFYSLHVWLQSSGNSPH